MVNNLYTCMSWILFFTFGCMYSSLLIIHIPQNGQYLVSKAHVFTTSLISTVAEIMSLVNGLSPPWSIIAMFGSSFSFHEEIMTCRSLSFISMRRRHFMHQGEAISIVVRVGVQVLEPEHLPYPLFSLVLTLDKELNSSKHQSVPSENNESVVGKSILLHIDILHKIISCYFLSLSRSHFLQ